MISVLGIFKNTHQLKLFWVFKLFGRKHEVSSQPNASVYVEHSLFSEVLNALQIFFFNCIVCAWKVQSSKLGWAIIDISWSLPAQRSTLIHCWGWKESIVHQRPLLRALECLRKENSQTAMLSGVCFLPFPAERKRAQYARKIPLLLREIAGRASCQCEGPDLLIPVLHVWRDPSSPTD